MSFNRSLIQSGSCIMVRLFELRHCEILCRISLTDKREQGLKGHKDELILLAGALFRIKDLHTVHTLPEVEKEELEKLDAPEKDMITFLEREVKRFITGAPAGGLTDRLLKYNVLFELVCYRIKDSIDSVYVSQLGYWHYRRIRDLTMEILTIYFNEWNLTNFLQCSSFQDDEFWSTYSSVYPEVKE